jgi:hypothetical protein
MPGPPPPVVLVARTHWLVGGAAAAAMAVVHFSTRHLPIAFSPTAYWSAGGFAVAYLVAGSCVWLGIPPGRVLSRVCGLLYLARPRFGSPIWDAMSLPEYRAHFERRRARAGK